MITAKSINPAKPLNPGLDFIGLKERGLDIIQELAGDIWTDYNEHDPGVTTLEQLCYALTELTYRAELPVNDLLARPGRLGIDQRRQALFAPQTILPCNPLTVNDYRKLIVDRVPGVANAWLTAYRSSRPGAVNGLFTIDLYVPDTSPDAAGLAVRLRAIRRRVRRTYTRHRSLCEDLHAIRVLTPIGARLTAAITIHSAAIPETVLARALYNAGNFVAPELRRQPLDALLADSRTPSEIFSGPRLRDGFVSDDQLQARAAAFTVSDLARTLLGTDDVIGVRDVRLAIDGAAIAANEPQSTLVVPSGRILTIDTRPIGTSFGIRVFKHDVECRPDPATVQRELDRLWADHRRRYDVAAQCERLLPLPAGTAVDVGQYYSLHHQFPAAYGVNAYGVPHDATDERRAQARQFKAYLLVFEQLLADGFARLAAVKDLCSTRGARRQPHYQYLDTIVNGETVVPDVAPLLKASYRTDLPRVIQSGDRALERWNRFLDVMLATYGETFESGVLPSASRAEGADGTPGALQARCKLEMLRQAKRIGRERGSGFDYLAPPSSGTVSGLETRSRLQLGMAAATPAPFAEVLDTHGIEIVDTAPLVERASMMRHARYIDQAFDPAIHAAADPHRHDPPRRVMSEDLLHAAAEIDHYRIGTLPGGTAVLAVCRAPSQRLWQLAGEYPDRDAAIAGIAALVRVARTVNRSTRRLYIVEHTLLRFGRTAAPVSHDTGFDPSFTASAIVCLPAYETDDPGYRKSVRDVVRSNTPAHVVVKTCFLRLSRICQFESLYREWRDALRRRRGRRLIGACQRLRDFLGPDRP